MIDFDEKFHKFYEKWMSENSGKYTYDELEDGIAEVYETWQNSADAELGGLSPIEWVAQRTSNELVQLFLDRFNEGEPDSFIVEAVEEREECKNDLINILKADHSDEVKIHVANMMLEIGFIRPAADVFCDWLCDPDCASELRDIAVEALKECADDVKARIRENLPGADIETKTLMAEVLICAKKDDKTFDLLMELFKSGKNTALYAGYLGKYGDERAAAALYKALDDCNYLEFTEIRNAIEVLGGVVDDEYRDFSDDEYYKAIKNLK